MIYSTLRALGKSLPSWTFVFIEPLIWNIGPLPLWLLTTTFSTFSKITLMMSSFEFPYPLLLHIFPLNILHVSHQMSNIHLLNHHRRLASIDKSVIQPGHKLAHLSPRVSNNSRSI